MQLQFLKKLMSSMHFWAFFTIFLSSNMVHNDVHEVVCKWSISWKEQLFIDQAIQFLLSFPKIFSAVGQLGFDQICSEVSIVVHYLDAFFFCSSHNSKACSETLAMAVPLCRSLGMPVAPHKVCFLTFLGIG